MVRTSKARTRGARRCEGRYVREARTLSIVPSNYSQHPSIKIVVSEHHIAAFRKINAVRLSLGVLINTPLRPGALIFCIFSLPYRLVRMLPALKTSVSVPFCGAPLVGMRASTSQVIMIVSCS